MKFLKTIDYDELVERLENLQPQVDDYPEGSNDDFDFAYWAARDMYDDVMSVIYDMEKYPYVKVESNEQANKEKESQASQTAARTKRTNLFFGERGNLSLRG